MKIVLLIAFIAIVAVAAYKLGEHFQWMRSERLRKREAMRRIRTYQIDKIVFADGSEKFQIYYIGFVNGYERNTPLNENGYFNTQAEAEARIREVFSEIVADRETVFKSKPLNNF